jgi:general stress protein 26
MKEQQHDNPATPEEVTDRIWELAEQIDICMLTTWTGSEQHSRPMSARVRRDENAFYFLTDVSGEKNHEIEEYPTVSLTWADNSNYRFVQVSGQAQLSDERAKIAELWSKMDEVWWESKDDPTIRLLKVTPERGEIWDSPHKVISGVKMLVSLVTGAAPNLGDNAEVRL